MANKAQWSVAHKLIFYFCFLFFGLNTFPFPLDFIGEPVYNLIEKFWTPIINLLGNIFLDLDEITVRPNGSGDTTWNWLQELAILIIASLGSIVWLIAARSRVNHEKLAYWLRIYLRYYLAATMLSYGLVKVFPLQFGTITTYRLYERLGEMSPMGLLWTFMAYSKGYQLFGGLMEVVSGLLLLFRRTTTLGALLSAGVMLNVFMMNLFFDVPVKIFSFWLMLIGIYLLSADAKRLWQFFVLNEPTQATQEIKVFADKKWFRIGRIVLKVLFIGITFVAQFYSNWQDSAPISAPKSAIYGPYKVEKFERNNIVSETDTLRLQEVFIDRRGATDMIYVTNEDGLRKRVNFELDSTKHIIRMGDYAAPITDTARYTFSYVQTSAETFFLKGKIKNDSIRVAMKKMKPRNFLLTTRGFHWVNEVPFNK
ncbi:DoxX family protein [Emticicia sp. W12TSBA100-4]|uniref:DoxX family protein n=1 Tax=Emticicia sp. W12TSBA100-4 TaxID=3160965 RepID=UPI0033056F9A